MSVLDVLVPNRMPVSVADPADLVPAVAMVDWEATGSDRWVARIGLDRAGEVCGTPLGYRLVDWDGADLGTWPTLAEAQRRLEPDVRAALRDAEESGPRLGTAFLGSAAVSAAVALLAAAGWFALQTL